MVRPPPEESSCLVSGRGNTPRTEAGCWGPKGRLAMDWITHRVSVLSPTSRRSRRAAAPQRWRQELWGCAIQADSQAWEQPHAGAAERAEGRELQGARPQGSASTLTPEPQPPPPRTRPGKMPLGAGSLASCRRRKGALPDRPLPILLP